MIRGFKDEDPVISRFVEYLHKKRGEHWVVIDEDIRCSTKGKNFDYLLLWRHPLKVLNEVEIKRLCDTYDGIPFKCYSDRFEKIESGLYETAKGRGWKGALFVEPSDLSMTCRQVESQKGMERLISNLEREEKISRTGKYEKEFVPFLTSGTHNIDEQIERGIRKIIKDASQQLSKETSRRRTIIIVNEYPNVRGAVIDVVRREVAAAIEAEKIEASVDEIYFDNSVLYDGDEIEVIYPTQNGSQSELI
ncbi:MAG: hypothetical protein L0196_07895 [candidate division Zixibacteria bacterium]|nr:hypothetical protein [candidate division Zixibacteria bacterium]